MENIVMASMVGQPVADGKIFAGDGAPVADGLFGLMFARELVNLTGEARKTGDRKDDQAACDPMLLMLMSILMQGAATNGAGQANESQTGIQTDMQVAGVQAGVQTGLLVFDGAGSRQDMQTGIAPAALAGQPGTAGPHAGRKARAAALALMQIVTDNRGIGAALNELNLNPPDEGGGNGGRIAELSAFFQQGLDSGEFPEQLITRLQTDVPALLATLEGNLKEMNANPAPQGRQAALETIRDLFINLVGDEPDGQDAPEPDSLPDQAFAAGLPRHNPAIAGRAPLENMPAGAADVLAVKLETVFRPILVGQAVGEGRATIEKAADGAIVSGAREEPANRKTFALDALPRPFAGGAPVAAADNEVKTQAAAQAAARPGAEAFDSIVQSITTLKESAGKEMEIQLKPSFLGKVVIRLSMDDGGLVARIAASNPRVQDTFLNQAVALQASLAEQGLKDVRIVVTSTSVQDPSLQQQADRRGQGQHPQPKRGRYAVGAVQPQGGQAQLMAYEMAYGAGTINYLA